MCSSSIVKIWSELIISPIWIISVAKVSYCTVFYYYSSTQMEPIIFRRQKMNKVDERNAWEVKPVADVYHILTGEVSKPYLARDFITVSLPYLSIFLQYQYLCLEDGARVD